MLVVGLQVKDLLVVLLSELLWWLCRAICRYVVCVVDRRFLVRELWFNPVIQVFLLQCCVLWMHLRIDVGGCVGMVGFLVSELIGGVVVGLVWGLSRVESVAWESISWGPRVGDWCCRVLLGSSCGLLDWGLSFWYRFLSMAFEWLDDVEEIDQSNSEPASKEANHLAPCPHCARDGIVLS